MWPDGAPCSDEGPERRERRALQNLLSVLCVLPHLLPIFPGRGEEEVPALTGLQRVPQTAATVEHLVPGLIQQEANPFCPHLFP